MQLYGVLPYLSDENREKREARRNFFEAKENCPRHVRGRPKDEVPCWIVVLSWRSGDGMTSITIISALLGVCLGLTFRVFILVPAALSALAIVSGSGAASEAGAFWMIVLDISVITAMQAGYIGGTTLFVAVAD
jgi:hypothetical protein